MVFYRLILCLLALPLLATLGLRWALGRISTRDLAERLGRRAPPTGCLWLHAASVGEVTAARSLIEALRFERDGLTFWITCNTPTARARVEGWDLPQTTTSLAPLDLRLLLKPLFQKAAPCALVIVENELWPNRIALAAARGVPLILASARMSERSAKGWARLGGLARSTLGHVTLAAAQDPQSAERLLTLGLPARARAPDLTLKATTSLPASDAQAPNELRPLFPRDKTLLAASTHAPEEGQILEAFKLIQDARPGARLILAPRHPQRGAEIAALIKDQGWRMAQRSQGSPPSPDIQVYLADTLGEMALWYSLAGTTFVGGSWAPRGGHTPFEPAAYGSAIFHGPDTANFAAPYAALAAAQGAQMVSSPTALAEAVLALTPETHATMTQAATAALADLSAQADPTPLAKQILALALPATTP